MNYAEHNKKEDLLLMAHVGMNASKGKDIWFLNSGCSNYTSGNKKWFSNIDEDFGHNFKLGTNTKMLAMGRGSIKNEVNGLTQVINDVFLCN